MYEMYYKIFFIHNITTENDQEMTGSDEEPSVQYFTII